jgi:membrane associated rhomboid family serine protease
MLDSGMAKRLPVLVLLGVIILITSIDWIHGFDEWLMVPANVVGAWEAFRAGDFTGETLFTLATTITAAFLHGDGGHLLMNMLFLWIFGVVVLELCGSHWLILVFVITAVGGSIGQIMLDPGSPIPVLGASGAVMGLEGFYFGLAVQRPRPNSHVWPLARPVNSGELAAFGVIGVALDFLGVLSPGQGIAYGAHIGGFVTGMILSLLANRFIPLSENH